MFDDVQLILSNFRRVSMMLPRYITMLKDWLCRGGRLMDFEACSKTNDRVDQTWLMCEVLKIVKYVQRLINVWLLKRRVLSLNDVPPIWNAVQ